MAILDDHQSTRISVNFTAFLGLERVSFVVLVTSSGRTLALSYISTSIASLARDSRNLKFLRDTHDEREKLHRKLSFENYVISHSTLSKHNRWAGDRD